LSWRRYEEDVQTTRMSVRSKCKEWNCTRGKERKSRGYPYVCLPSWHNVYFRYQTTPFLLLRIFLCSCSIPYSRASAVGGQPGTYRSTGTIRSHPRTTEYESVESVKSSEA
jgi:hypothetical protein